MGILGLIIHNIKNMKRAKKLRAMTEAEWESLDDESFYDAIFCVCEDAVYEITAPGLTKPQIYAYSLFKFEAEVNNGGLCQFFVNSSRECAPYISDALEQVGAAEIKERFDRFVADNQIDVNHLESFIVESVEEYADQAKRFDFDSFDDEFYKDLNLHHQIIDYCKKHRRDLLVS